MQPSDNTPAQTPPPQQPKQSFWSKLFGKKPAPIIPPHESLAPPPQLDENTPESTAPAVNLQPAAPQTDSITGAPEANDLSAPDGNGDITSLPVDVPSSIQTSAEGLEGTPPTVPVEQPVAQPVQPQQPVEPQVVTPVPAAEPTPPFQPAQPVENSFPPVQSQQPVQPQPAQPQNPNQQ